MIRIASRVSSAAALVLVAACGGESFTPPVIGNSACNPLPVGGLATFTGSAGCVTGASGAEFTLVAYNSSQDGSSKATATIAGSGLGLAPASALVPDSPSPAAAALLGAGAPTLDEGFHLRQMERARLALSGKATGARQWYANRTASSSLRRNVIPVSPTVGQVITVNVNGDSACNAPRYRGVRIAAVGTKSVILADTLNPAGGFTDADYQRFASRFDNLVYPLDVSNFGAPSDIDGNGRVAILFTSAVNALTDAGSTSLVGGFFFGRDLYPTTTQNGLGGCSGSNVGEMFYMLAPDPNGQINGNVRRTGFVDTLTTGVLAHEFQHLINSSRRLYVNTSARDVDEVVWLNEGLSHVAEELLYYSESGKSPRQNLSGADVYTNSRTTYPMFIADAANNFGRLVDYLQAPGDNSPSADDDSLATRGAAWSFLRYSVDQLGGDDKVTWNRFDNSTTSGWGTVQFALGQDPGPFVRNWTIANYVDDLGITNDAHYQHLSWNYRSIYNTVFGSYNGNVFTPMGYPLVSKKLSNATPVTATVHGSSAAYYRFAVPAGSDATFTMSSGGGAPSTSLQFMVVRTK